MPNHEWLSAELLKTVGGAGLAVWFVGSAVQHVFKRNPRWLALVLAEVIAIVVAQQGSPLTDPLSWLVALLNGCVIYVASVGTNNIAHSVSADRRRARGDAGPERSGRSFASLWW